MDVETQDVQDALSLEYYKAGAPLRVSPTLDALPRRHYSLFAVSQLFGWAIIATSSDANPSSPSSLVLTRLDDLQAALDQAECYAEVQFQADQWQTFIIPTASFCSNPSIFITHVVFASWDRLIFVATSDGTLHIFSLYALTNENTQTPIKSIPSASLVPLKMLAPNPSKGGPLSGVIAAVYQDGTIKLFDSYQSDQAHWTAQLATVAEWSPMGKRLLVGYTNGQLEFVTPEGTSKGKIDPPALVKEQALSVLSIKWLDQKNYLVTFIQPIDEPEALSETFCLHVPRQSELSACTYSRVTDALISDGATSLPPDIFTLTLPVHPQTNWKHLILSSFTLSSTFTLIGYNTSDKPFQLILSEENRPEIPVAQEDYSPTAALGLGTSYCTSQKFPLVWCYTTDGILAVWKVKLVNPSEESNFSEVWNEIPAYIDIAAVEEKGIEGPPAAASSMNATASAQPQAGLASSQSASVSAFGTQSSSLASSQVTAFGKPSMGVSGLNQSTGFGTSAFLNQSGSSSLAFGKSSLGASSSPFANLLSGSTSGGFNSFASPSSLNPAASTSSASASANSGFAAFSSSSGNAGFNTGFSAFSNSSDNKLGAGFASFSTSSGIGKKTEPGAFGQFAATNSQPSFLGGNTNTTTKTRSIFDNPAISEGENVNKPSSQTIDNANISAFGVTKPPQGSAFSTGNTTFGSSPPSTLRRSVNSSREASSLPEEGNPPILTGSAASVHAHTSNLPDSRSSTASIKPSPAPLPPLKTSPAQLPPPKTSPAQLPPPKTSPAQLPPPKTSPAQLPPVKTSPVQLPPPKITPAQLPPVKTSPAQLPPSHDSKCPPSQVPQKVTPSPKPAATTSSTAPPSSQSFLVARPEFIAPITVLSEATVPKIYVNNSPESFSKPDGGLSQASSKIIDSITSEINCLESVGLVCRRYLSECCKKASAESVALTQAGLPILFFGDLSDVFQHVQDLIKLAKQKIMENEARLQAVTALDNAHIKADMKVEEIKRILRLRNDPGFSQIIRTRQLGPVQLTHQKEMRRLIRDVKHGISQMSDALESFESRHREATTRRNKIQPPSLDTINRCIRFITLGLTQHIINLEKLHLRVSQHKTKTLALKDKRESLGVSSLSSPQNSSPDQAAALTALMSEHRGAILKESILKRGDEPILTRAQTSLPTDLSGESSGLSHIRTSGIIIVRPRQRSQF